MRRLTAAMVAISGLLMTSCAMTREQKLERQADKVESSLKSERNRVLTMPPGDADREARLDHLSSLRATLTAANVARGLVPHLVEGGQRDVAYDVLEETYSTIDWNIPLDPKMQQPRQLPAGFSGGMLELNAAQPKP